jgi:hypothetical protein
VNLIPESPPECEALLAEALEALARFPVGSVSRPDVVGSWWLERGHPTAEMLIAHLYPDSVTPST